MTYQRDNSTIDKTFSHSLVFVAGHTFPARLVKARCT